MLRELTDSLLVLAFPQECHVCKGGVSSYATGVACDACWNDTKFFSGHEMLCNKCGAFFSDETAQVPVYCHKCDDHLYAKAYALGIYEKALAAAILDLKKTPRLPRLLASTLSQAVDRLPHADLIIPIPLSKQRFLERGYNQAEVIASAISRSTRILLDSGTLRRRKHTPIHRIGMDQRARELTVEKAFEVTRPKLVADRSVLLIDDVFTSGSTASACAAALKKSGASSVFVFTLARAVMR